MSSGAMSEEYPDGQQTHMRMPFDDKVSLLEKFKPEEYNKIALESIDEATLTTGLCEAAGKNPADCVAHLNRAPNKETCMHRHSSHGQPIVRQRRQADIVQFNRSRSIYAQHGDRNWLPRPMSSTTVLPSNGCCFPGIASWAPACKVRPCRRAA